MQDPKQKQPGAKQYFDIKGPSKADATSRPGIISKPIQSDPMVSSAPPSPEPASIKITDSIHSDNKPEEPVDVLKTVVGDDLAEDEGLGVKHLDKPGTELPEDQIPVKTELPDLSDFDNNAVEYAEPQNKKAPDIETLTIDNIGLEVRSVGNNHTVDLDKEDTGKLVNDSGVNPSDFSDSTSQLASTEPAMIVKKQEVPQHEPLNLPVEPFPIKSNKGLKISIALLVLILLIIISFVVYKYKTGQ